MGHIQSKTADNGAAKQPTFFIPSREEAFGLLSAAEGKDMYRARSAYNALNMKARAGMRYEPAATTAAAAPVIPTIPSWLSRGLPDRIALIHLDSTADGGMPHTRATSICCPGGTQLESRTIIHELIHVHQKANAAAWAAIYADALQMKPWLGTLPNELEYRRRINPDTVQAAHWIWRDRWVPVPIFLRPEAPRLADMRVYFYDAETTEWQSMPPLDWLQFFGDLPDNHQEHPHELAAYWISENRDIACPAYRRFKKAVQAWFAGQ